MSERERDRGKINNMKRVSCFTLQVVGESVRGKGESVRGKGDSVSKFNALLSGVKWWGRMRLKVGRGEVSLVRR